MVLMTCSVDLSHRHHFLMVILSKGTDCAIHSNVLIFVFYYSDLSDLKDDQPCEYCLNEYHNIMEAMDVQKVRSD